MAMLATLVIAGLIAVMMSRSVTETRVTSSARDRETAIHVAEAAIDDVIVHVNDDDDYRTTQPDGTTEHEFDIPLTSTQAQEKAWAIALASDDTKCTVVVTDGGEACGIRPYYVDSSTGNETSLPWIYGVGFVPSRANAVKTRVVKIQFDQGYFSPSKAILTGPSGDAVLGAKICGTAADVHTNGSIKLLGGADLTSDDDCPGGVDGNVTSKGTYIPAGRAGPRSGQTGAELTVPNIEAREVYRRAAADEAAKDDPGTTEIYEGTWFDLCPNGEVHRPTFDAAGEPGAMHRSGAPALLGRRGLRRVGALSGQGWDVDRSELVETACTTSSNQNAKIRGGSGHLNFSVIAQAPSPCVGRQRWRTREASSSTVKAPVARSSRTSRTCCSWPTATSPPPGTVDTEIHGVVAAHEQVELGGNVTVLRRGDRRGRVRRHHWFAGPARTSSSATSR